MSYLVGRYDGGLVLLSIVMAVFASYTALDLARRVSVSRGRWARFWLVGGAFAMGIGIWAMHFIGMLAFSLPIPLGYDIGITLVSLAIAVAVSGGALYTVSRDRLTNRSLVVGSLLMGAGICGMHYTGMAAMRMQPGIVYDSALVLASLAIAVAASIAALWIAFTLSRSASARAAWARLGAAGVMGGAIAGMHYTGMAAARFAEGSLCLAAGGLDNHWLAYGVAVLSVLVLAATLLISVVDARLAGRNARLAASLQAANRELTRLALHDALTGLPNRVLLEDRIAQAIGAARRSGRSFALLFLDLDGFKAVNDSLGHHQGDALLVELARRLLACIREEDTIARLGGDEFVALVENLANPEDAARIAEKLIARAADAVLLSGQSVFVSASVGIAVFPGDGDTPEHLLAHADAAMYHVKMGGRNDYAFFEPVMNQNAHFQLALQNALRNALAAGHFELHYQPKLRLDDGVMVGVEALLRWRDPERGLVPPGEFLAIAERSGLIIPIGDWVIEEACAQARRWREAGLPAFPVAVNLAAQQFRHKLLVATVSLALARNQLPPSALILEVTESTAMAEPEQTRELLETFNALGIAIAIDDFGTGYSSLAYLKRFPMQKLKIDRSFVQDLAVDQDDQAIVRAIIALAHSLQLKVVAEGVETEDQRRLLENLGCDESQGFLHARPMPAPDLADWVCGKACAPRPWDRGAA